MGLDIRELSCLKIYTAHSANNVASIPDATGFLFVWNVSDAPSAVFRSDWSVLWRQVNIHQLLGCLYKPYWVIQKVFFVLSAVTGRWGMDFKQLWVSYVKSILATDTFGGNNY